MTTKFSQPTAQPIVPAKPTSDAQTKKRGHNGNSEF